MGLMDTYGWKFTKNEHMTPADVALFKRYRDAGVVTFYKVAKCQGEGCTAEIPKSKKYCSKKCVPTKKDDDDGSKDQ